jgi:hypothetical protein
MRVCVCVCVIEMFISCARRSAIEKFAVNILHCGKTWKNMIVCFMRGKCSARIWMKVRDSSVHICLPLCVCLCVYTICYIVFYFCECSCYLLLPTLGLRTKRKVVRQHLLSQRWLEFSLLQPVSGLISSLVRLDLASIFYVWDFYPEC